MSHLSLSEVVLQPRAGPTGRYELAPRVGFIAAIRNLGDHRTGISEASFSVTANEAGQLQQLSAVIQRNTLEPGEATIVFDDMK